MECRRRLSVQDLTLLPDRSSGLLVEIPYFAEVAASSYSTSAVYCCNTLLSNLCIPSSILGLRMGSSRHTRDSLGGWKNKIGREAR